MLSLESAALVVVDVQGRLAELMHGREALFRNVQIAIRAARILRIPILWLEQNPGRLGPTVPEIASLMSGEAPLSKMTFSACGCSLFLEGLKKTGRKQVILAGIEAHVCIYLTAADLLRLGYEVEVLADAVSSRLEENKRIGLAKAQALGAGISCLETVLFEMLRSAEAENFKQIVGLLK
jgi:nicotinamidase-related amidase